MTTRCEDCGKGKGPKPFYWSIGSEDRAGRGSAALQMCPVCAGKLIAALLAYFKERTRLGLRGPRRAKDAKKPLHVQGVWRCRRCEVQLHDYKMGGPAFCEECR